MEQLMRKLQRLRAEEEHKLWKRLVELLELTEDEGSHLVVNLYSETHFAVDLACPSCGYRSHIATLSIDAPEEVWRSAIIAGAQSAYRRLQGHKCVRGGVAYAGKGVGGDSQ